MQYSLNPNKDIAIKIHTITYLMDRIADHTLRKGFDLTFAHYRFLRMLRSKAPISQQEIASSCGLTPAAVSKLALVLVVRGLISRRTNLKNRRKRELTITDKGEQEVQRARTLLERKFDELFGALSTGERAALHRGLDKLLSEAWKEGK